LLRKNITGGKPMPWRVTSMIEERLKFVLEALNPQFKFTFIDLCKQYNISPRTGYKWVNRFLKEGEKGLEDSSRAPLTNPTKISKKVEDCIIYIRNLYPKWGPKKIRIEFLNNFKDLKVPSEGSIGNIISKNGLANCRFYRRHVAKTSPLAECLEPNDIWMYDFKGWFLTASGEKCEPLTITDGFSRYLFECRHMMRKRGCDVWSILERLFYEYGLPRKMRSDNGPPFASLAVGRLSALSIKLIKIGVIPEWINPGCPHENGRHERFHLTLKKETATPPALNLGLQQEKFNQFKIYYNNKRYHEALGQKIPASVYKPSTRVWDGKYKSPEYSNDYEIRKITNSGHAVWKGSAFFVSELLRGEYIGIKEIEFNLMGVYYGPILLGKFDLSKGFKRV
jgi:putative transposase